MALFQVTGELTIRVSATVEVPDEVDPDTYANKIDALAHILFCPP